ncbi:glycosyltransferase family 9 protein [Rhizobium sp. Root491]|uniref:glycosyltransferase family 9 protein n=1 Tax=Rhizobium sp. Root491 TaxID=1736548 RepID=UPI000AF8DDD3|nr:glycosyltransferase family 9 protein [Rhizobium sp. Root491]
MAVFKTIEQKLRRAYKRRKLASAGIVQNDDGAILITGGFGDLIVVARFLRDLSMHLGGGKFSIFYNSPAVAEIVFKSVPGFKGAYPSHFFKYAKDICLYGLKINQFIYVEKWPAHRALANGDKKIFELVRILEAHEKKIEPLDLMRSHHPYLDGTLGRYAAIKGRSRNDFLHYAAGIAYGGDALSLSKDETVLDRHGLVAGKYITLHNGYDEAMQSLPGQRATKAYPGWANVVSDLRVRFGDDVKFVQIGTAKTSEPIAGVHLNLIGKTSLIEALGLLEHTAFHMDNEGGFVHAAAAFGKKSCVVFGPTSVDYFGYPSNLNFAPLQCGDCWWSEKTWMMMCPKGDSVPSCMAAYDPGILARDIYDWWRIQNVSHEL